MEQINHQNINKIGGNRGSERLAAGDVQPEGTGMDVLEKTLQQNPETFLLNNLLLSVQFFENYDRDVRLLREHWYKEISLEPHHKKCYYADALLRLAGGNVKFSPRHGPHKQAETSLQPLRIYVSSDNVEAAYDPSALGRNNRNVSPQYRFTVRTSEKKEKSGCVYLVEYKREGSRKSPRIALNGNAVEKGEEQDGVHFRKSNWDAKRRFTRTEKFIGFHGKDGAERRGSLWCSADAPDTVISSDAFYRFTRPEARLKPVPIYDFRMNRPPSNSHEIPLPCFQRQDVKVAPNARRGASVTRNGLSPLFRSETVLNSAAFKAHFCDLLLERLTGVITSEDAAVSAGSVLEEFVLVDQSGMQCGIAPVIAIRDWNNFIAINKPLKEREKKKAVKWPSSQMLRIINILPCHAVPGGLSPVSEENPDYEKDWKLVFPKAEEFLLLHMMHAHVRCYLFALLVYKSFIEAEINVASFGPKHLLHLLFWKVQKNFLAWPEDRPGETFLLYLKTLYKKLQNKSLPDFFITSRNLFATSLPKDLHKAQALIKKILENPVPFVIRAIRNLQLKPDFYPALDALKLYNTLIEIGEKEKPKQTKREKKQKQVRFENDEERLWKRTAFKQIELERKVEEEENAPKLSVDSIDIERSFNFDASAQDKCIQVLEIFLSHFIKMRSKSLEFQSPSQGVFYLELAQRMLDLTATGGNLNDLKSLKEKLNRLQENGSSSGVRGPPKSEYEKEKRIQPPAQKPENVPGDVKMEWTTAEAGDVKIESTAETREVKVESTAETGDMKIKIIRKETSEDLKDDSDDDDDDDGENEMYETKL